MAAGSTQWEERPVCPATQLPIEDSPGKLAPGDDPGQGGAAALEASLGQELSSSPRAVWTNGKSMALEYNRPALCPLCLHGLGQDPPFPHLTILHPAEEALVLQLQFTSTPDLLHCPVVCSHTVSLKGRQGGREGALCGLAPPQPPDSTVALPLREIGPPDDTGIPRLQYWPFSTSDLYNWKTQSARFSDNPRDLLALLDSVMFTHQPTWDDCQQLLRILFTTEEREKIQVEARKLVLGDDGQPTANPDLINATFPLTRPVWDYNTAEVCL
ncbi:uncharacterized protein LOC126934424 [Macaca thibetana thibetana]|uniref:uncharacterized protein LOC126934424 n=1 Tax=Macaca thibetana thibetana TaxID=257877 RepID=UPI0021BCF60D|nr:uncharacterized protein LOC126934424 [Macaca thibetana thibetana]